MDYNIFDLPHPLKDKIYIEPNSGCWLWGGCWSGKCTKYAGYGQVRQAGVLKLTHRVVYEFFRGVIPLGLEIDHLCRTRPCCNPNHLEAVSHQINMKRGDTGKCGLPITHCPSGHEYIKPNIKIGHDGYKYCHSCKKISRLKSYYNIKNKKILEGGILE